MTALAPPPARPTTTPELPRPRGPWSELLFGHLVEPAHTIPEAAPAAVADPIADDDLNLALYCCYELHYRGFAGVDADWEWEPSLLAFRRTLEAAFESALRQLVRQPRIGADDDVAAALRTLVDRAGGPSLSRYLEQHGTLDELREMAIHRSAYQLKEADPHSWAIPRLSGAAKAAMVEIQADEYGAGDPDAVHATMFANTMAALGLDASYGAYLDLLPGTTLATTNLISLFGLHRRLRGALVGHLALFEMTSVVPMGRYAAALARLGVDPTARRFYDAHVEADAVHQFIACDGMVAGLVAAEPDLAGDVLFGASAVLALEDRFARSLLNAWSAGRTSLLRP